MIDGYSPLQEQKCFEAAATAAAIVSLQA